METVNVNNGDKQSEVNQISEANVESANVSKPIPGTTLKCLEDPSFEFDGHAAGENESCANQPPPAKKPAYRVLEGTFLLAIAV